MQDVDWIQKLRLVENDLLTSLLDAQMLVSYRQTWSVLSQELSAASQNGDIGLETLSFAHLVATRVSEIASCFLEIKHKGDCSTSQLRRDCDAMIQQMARLNIDAQPKSSYLINTPGTSRSSAYSNAPATNTERTSPSFIVSAYRWLLDNLHNPYPTAAVKTQIAATSSCQVSSVNSWFINARRRIGWTTLCREHFSNCRADMFDAAYRALVEEHPRRPLSPELRHSFIAMRVAAENLHASAFTSSVCADNSEDIIKNMTKESGDGKRNQVGKTSFAQVVQDSYPSPSLSITASPVSALDDSPAGESEEEDVAAPVVAGIKRHRSVIEPVDEPSSSVSRPIKRLRASIVSRTCLPSPPTSTNDVDESSNYGLSEGSPAHSTHTMLPSRKGCLPDTDVSETPKPPSYAPAAHPQIVSDPLPRSDVENEYSIDDWFKTNFDDLFAIPPPVDAVQPDLSASWEVELFKDYNIPGNPECAPKYPLAPEAGISDPRPSISPDPNGPLRPVGSDSSVAALDILLPPSVAGAAYTSPLGTLIADISQATDWTSLLDGTEAYQSSVYSFPQFLAEPQPLPEIDLSMVQLPRVIPTSTAYSEGDISSKQAKIHQLHAMQEAVWRMEQELRSEGVVV